MIDPKDFRGFKGFLKSVVALTLGYWIIIICAKSPGSAVLLVGGTFLIAFAIEIFPLYQRHVAALELMAGISSPEKTQDEPDEDMPATMESP